MKKVIEAAIALLNSGDTGICDNDEITIQRNQFKRLQDIVKAETNTVYGPLIPEFICDGCLCNESACECARQDDDETFDGHFIVKPGTSKDGLFWLCGQKLEGDPVQALQIGAYSILEKVVLESEVAGMCDEYNVEVGTIKWV